jgi:hypothetical protein
MLVSSVLYFQRKITASALMTCSSSQIFGDGDLTSLAFLYKTIQDLPPRKEKLARGDRFDRGATTRRRRGGTRSARSGGKHPGCKSLGPAEGQEVSTFSRCFSLREGRSRPVGAGFHEAPERRRRCACVSTRTHEAQPVHLKCSRFHASTRRILRWCGE